jgi:hypothetical protein
MSQLATSPLLTNFAIARSQAAIRKVGNFIFPLCEVPDLVVRYKSYDEKHRFRVPNTKREIGGKATRLSFGGSDVTITLEPNALDFPIPNVDGLSDQGLEYSMMEGQSILADASGLSLEVEQINLAISTLTAGKKSIGYGVVATGVSTYDPIGDPTNGLDALIKSIMLVAPGVQIKVLFGTTAFFKFRQNTNVLKKYIVSSGSSGKSGNVGVVSPDISDVGRLLFGNPMVELSTMVSDTTPEGVASSLQFVLNDNVVVFASNDTPNRMDPSFGKTFARMGGFFRPGTYQTEDQRDQVLKMDWTTLPQVTNAQAGVLVDTSPTS